MPAFKVRWTKFAQSRLIQIWLNATDRNAVTAAANLIDRELADAPATKGRPIIPGFREYEASPLSVVYRIDVATGFAVVIAVKRIDPSRNGPLVTP